MKTLYVVATPIGNLEDITLRALNVLKDVDIIAAEDTRHTKKLLQHYCIRTQVTSYYEHNEIKKAEWLVEQLNMGKDVALVSDAGTPGISDPGYRLVKMATEHALAVVSVPGPSAIISALSMSGLPTDSFCFEGFIPSKSGQRKKFLSELKDIKKTVVFYESPKRLMATLEDVNEILGNADMVIAREMTKLHEEVIRGKARKILADLKGREIKGETTVLLNPRTIEAERGVSLADEIKNLQRETDLPLKEIARIIAEKTGLPKRDVYKEALKIKEMK